jgi:UDPglucose 6-dehydrogenase
LLEHARIAIYDPQVEPETILRDLADAGVSTDLISTHVEIHTDPYAAVDKAHALVALTEWDEFRDLDFQRIHELMLKPAFVFDGRAILPASALERIGFDAFTIGRGL